MPKLMISFYRQQLFVSSQSYNKCLPGIHEIYKMKESKIRIFLSFHRSNLSLKYPKGHAALAMLIRSFCNHLDRV